MRPKTARIALAAAGLAVAGMLGGAQAAAPAKARTLVFTDATGDSIGAPGDDLAKVTYSTTGTTTKVGKATTYKAKALTMTLETAKDIVTDGTVLYEARGSVAGCGDFYVNVAPGAALELVFGSCSGDDTVNFDSAGFEVNGRKLTFTVALGSVPGLKAGAKVSDLAAYTGTVDPATGIVGPFGATEETLLANDGATGIATYTIG